MDEFHMVRGMLLRIGRGLPASAPLAKAVVEWALPHADWLVPGRGADEEELGWEALLAGIEGARNEARPPHCLLLAGSLAELLDLEPFDHALLIAMVACDRLPRLSRLAAIVGRHGHDLPTLLGELAGAPPHDAERAVRRSQVLRLGLVGFVANRQGVVEVDVRWTLERMLDRAPQGGAEMIEALVGKRQEAALTLDDFASVEDADFLVRLLAGALSERAAGVNILIHGPPGTGKTEFARTLGAAAGAALHGVGEVDEDGDEPTRWDRVNALQIAQRVLAKRGQAILLFDEMEDLIGDARPNDDWFANRQGSKVFINRLLEANPVPVIWTTNAIGNIDRAILRRMSFVLKLDLPPRRAALRMLDRVTADEGVIAGAGLTRLIDTAPETATVLRVAARAARLAGEADGGVRPAEALVRALRGGTMPLDGPGMLDLDLFETSLPLSTLFDAIAAGDGQDVSLLLSGSPGTGKTALAHHLARALDRPLVVKRASDLLSKWVGETEAQIAAAFAEARRRGGVLLFDEADSLLFDRGSARTTWEVGQVNELLTWLDRHPLPVVAATNHPGKLDPATLRRFVFKLELRALGPERAAAAFERFFCMAAPSCLAEVRGLTPGDFAVVARQLRHAPARGLVDIVERLRMEAAAKPESVGRIGF
jgi:SpoVK/Ycf46/Vps4 family AAA+-type ATPase